jgi:hypothetical protein
MNKQFNDISAKQQFSNHTLNFKVAGSFPDGVTGSFHWHNPSGHAMALGLTQPLTEMITTNNS